MSNAVVDETLRDGAAAGTPSADLVEAISAALEEPPWLRDRRLDALRAFQALSWPSGQEEEWRRTPMAEVPLHGYEVLINNSPAIPARLAALDLASGNYLQQVDGVVLAQSLQPDLASQGVLLMPLAQAAREHERLLRTYLHQTLPFSESRFTALSAALWTQGLFCYVPKGVQVQGSLRHLIGKSPLTKHTATDETGSGHGLFGQTLLVAEEGSAVTLIEAAASDDGAAPDGDGGAALGYRSLLHRSIEIVAGANSDTRYVGLQHWGADAHAFVTERVRTARDARVLAASVVFGGSLSRERIELDAAGTGINAELIGLFVGTGRQHIEYDTRQDHHAVGGASTLQIKGALDDHATAVQYGVIAITPEAQKTSSHQIMRNLLLSDGAGADPIPVLEIEADDVKCSHAAAVGPVDPQHIFYLQSRGIPPAEAERLVVQGFLDVVAQRLPDEDLRHTVEALVHEKLNASAAAPLTGGDA